MEINIEPDISIFVENEGNEGSYGLSADLVEYRQRYRPREYSDLKFIWQGEEESLS